MINAFSFFADENSPPELTLWLEEEKHIVSGIGKENLHKADDEFIIKKCYEEERIILTYDTDFGKLIFTKQIPFYCIIFLRPGHFNGYLHIPVLIAILQRPELIKKRYSDNWL